MKRGFKFQPNWNQELPVYWFDNNPVKTHFMNAFQFDFPGGEKYIIDSIRVFKKDIQDVELQEDIEELFRQESWHTKVHTEYNSWLEKCGYPIHKMHKPSDTKVTSDLGNLACTVITEHLTVVISDWITSNPDMIEKMHPHFKEMWQWHMGEESDHRGVSYDVWNTIVNKVIQKHPSFQQTSKKILNRALPRLTFLIYKNMLLNTITLLRKDGQLYKWKTLKDFLTLMFNPRSGFVIHTLVPTLNLLRKDFHPWKYASNHK